MLAASSPHFMSSDWQPQTADGSVPEMSEQDLITRMRVEYTKGQALRFTGHLDLQRLWERLLRRSGLPVRYSQGYHPRARLNLASALPLGFISECELLDFWMDDLRSEEEVQNQLAEAAPPGIAILSVCEVDLREASLQSRMYASEYEVTFFNPQEREGLNHKIQKTLAQAEIFRKRRGKSYDLRPLILDLELRTFDHSEHGLWMRLMAEPGATGRPDEVLDEIGYENTQYLVRRTQLLLKEQEKED